jgi:arylsulfatase A-like enzyme
VSRYGAARAAVLALLAAALACAPAEPAPRFRNLVLVIVDTLRSDHLPSYGYRRDTAPHLARLAAAGVQVQGWAPSSWTRPSVATMLTGLLPQRHQTITRADGLPRQSPYLPQLLTDAGFATAAFLGNPNSARGQGFGRGFARLGESRSRGKLDGARVTDRALALAAGLEPRFFLLVHYLDPHDPYQPARSWGGAPPPRVQPHDVLTHGAAASADDVARMVDAYDGEVREADAAIERLLGGLDRAGLLDGTLVVITADHGEELAEHGGLTHGATLHEEVLRVPLVLWSRGGLRPARSAAVFALVDLAPTLLGALGVEVPPGLDGRSQWPGLAAARVEPRPHLAHLDLDRKGGLALLDGGRKLVHRNAAPWDRLYDLGVDAAEQAPLDPAPAELASWRGRALRTHNALAREALPRRDSRARGRLRQQLAALGYLGAGTTDEDLEIRVVPRRLGEGGLRDAAQTAPRQDVPAPWPGGRDPLAGRAARAAQN